MTGLSMLLLAVSLGVLALGARLLTVTGNRMVGVNIFFGSMMLLFAAYEATARHQPEWIVTLPFFATMLFGGRALGWWWRTRREADWREPAQLITAVTALSLVGTFAAVLER